MNDRDFWRPEGQLRRNPLGQLAAIKAGTVAYSGSYADTSASTQEIQVMTVDRSDVSPA